jgi:uncharacterized protein YhdP
MKLTPIKQDKIIEFALHQLDNIGFELHRRGLTDQVNRHNLAALAMNSQQRLKGEMTRLELRIGLQKLRLDQIRTQADQRLGKVVNHLPAPLAKPINKARSALLHA